MSLERFRQVYSTLPEKERELPVAVIDGTAITWNIAFKEIGLNSAFGKKIQKKLEELQII